MTNFEKITLAAFGVLIIVVFLIGAVVFRQQKVISALSGGAAGISKQSVGQGVAKKGSGPPLTEVVRQISGTVESISGNQLMISAKLADFSKPKNPEKFKNTTAPGNLKSDDFEKLEKKITVTVNEKTVFLKKPLAELKAGDAVSVSSDKSPYTSDTVTAEKIITQ